MSLKTFLLELPIYLCAYLCVYHIRRGLRFGVGTFEYLPIGQIGKLRLMALPCSMVVLGICWGAFGIALSVAWAASGLRGYLFLLGYFCAHLPFAYWFHWSEAKRAAEAEKQA